VSPLLPRLRAEVIAGGALICARIAVRLGVAELIVSETDILDGCAHELLPEVADRYRT
jgi:exopolyphosphatase/guanosine-5'-triphosphate,3'-diphosphate pyrophosphatase